LNGVSFATDMAKRSVVIKIKRPTYSGKWQDDAEGFIDDNREAIIADCIGFLMRPADYQFENFTRWGNWERDVLSRLPEPGEAQRVILERQGAADAEGEESSDLEEAIRQKLLEGGYSPDEVVVFIPSKVAAECLSEVSGERYGTTKASRTINHRIDEGRIQRINRNSHKGHGRGFLWCGANASLDEKVNTDLEVRLKRNTESSKRGF
jgi:hypothetical protein